MNARTLFKRSMLLSILFLAFGVTGFAQTTPLPYYLDFDHGSAGSIEAFNWKRFVKAADNENDFPWYVSVHQPFSEPFSLMHTCGGPNSKLVDDWCVSPVFAFPAGGMIDSLRAFSGAAGMPATTDTVAIYLLQGSQDPALATSKKLLYDFRGADFPTGMTWAKVTNVAIPPTTGNCYIAFRFKAASNCISIFLDNLQLSGKPLSGVPGTYRAGVDFSVGPNPATGSVSINTGIPFETMSVYDRAGKKVYDGPFRKELSVAGLPAGTYLLELTGKDHRRGTAQIVKQ